jgi:hypothetical protein
VWLHLICCSPIVPVCQVCPSDSSQAFLWQSSLRSIHTHFVETLQHSITGSQPHHSQPPSLRAVYFAPDLSMRKDEMDPRNRLSTDVWANIDHVLRQLWGSLYDFNFSQGNPPFCNERREASIDNALRKYVTPSLRAGALVLCQHLPEAARILEEGNLPLDACVLSCIFDVAGLCPRFERKDGPCVGAAGYTIKAFSSRITPPGSSLLPTGQDSTIDLCSYLALALDSSQNLSLPLQTIMPSSNISIQLLAFIFVHLHRSHQTGAIFSFPLERAVQQRLDPSRAQTISISGGCKYLEAVCNFAAKYFEEDTKGDPLHLVEAARMYAEILLRVAPASSLTHCAISGTSTLKTSKNSPKCSSRPSCAASLSRINTAQLMVPPRQQLWKPCALKLPQSSNSRSYLLRRQILPL